jgi:tRNA-dihydrouridine synthase A
MAPPPKPKAVRRGLLRPVSVAPMMKYTDRHFRAVMRQITRRTLLYTEMVTTGAILHGRDRERHLGFSPELERPLALQLGGDDPEALRRCARIAQDWGYDEVNLNVGCPSDRVAVAGSFGACLMARPEHVAECVGAMRAEVSIPVTVKHRIGIDDHDSYEHMLRFVDVVSAASGGGCDRFTVHARKAWLGGLYSPKQNRTIPPLRHEEVWRLKKQRPELAIELNGGLTSLAQCTHHLRHGGVDAVMIGRAAYDNPLMFSEVDRCFFEKNGQEEEEASTSAVTSAFEVVESLMPYMEAHLMAGGRLHHITRHMLMLFRGQVGGRRWRRALGATLPRGADLAVVSAALSSVRELQEQAASQQQQQRCTTPRHESDPH